MERNGDGAERYLGGRLVDWFSGDGESVCSCVWESIDKLASESRLGGGGEYEMCAFVRGLFIKDF
jgi:hypothetical protein